jgi:hypothetical protein
MPQPGPGDIVESQCPRCNDVTGHVVVALVGGRIVKAECRACGGVHRYRPPSGAAAVARAATTAPSSGSAGRAAPSPEKITGKITEKITGKAAGKAAGIRALRAAADLEREWEKAVALAPGAGARLYSMLERFEKDELIEHPVFGRGVVRELVPPDKMRILFRDGQRLLRCGG